VIIPTPRSAAEDERSQFPDSYKYYGPQGLWKTWSDQERLGRDTWIFWTWGNQRLLRDGARLAGRGPSPTSLDFFRMLDSRNRDSRFERLGLINEPNFVRANSPDRYGLWLDEWKGDPYYPNTEAYPLKTNPQTGQPISKVHYGLAKTVDGRGTGIVGLRLFDNPEFKPEKWNRKEYFKNPGRVEPPYLVGFSCAFCHMAFDPTNPPADPANPRWENLAANIGNQFFREGEQLFGSGRIAFGDRNPGPDYELDPYDTQGLGPTDFLYHYAATQQPGTSETSRISYDFINNPNTINPFFRLRHRPTFTETAPNGQQRAVMHILKDGADSVGLEWALMRVPINIGCEGTYWTSRLFNPGTGRRQRPFRITEVLSGLSNEEKNSLTEKHGLRFDEVTAERAAELKAAFGPDFGKDWQEALRRVPALTSYLVSYEAFNLQNAPGGTAEMTPDATVLARGRKVFARHCADCHSSQQPPADMAAADREAFYIDALSGDQLQKNFLSDDRRYPVTQIGTNMARAIASNAVDGDVWAEFSSKEYKALDAVGRVRLSLRPFTDADAVTIDFEPLGGGRGYYRTPSLISMWATAPYFHNNSLGKYNPRVDVASRLEAFEDGCTKLLWPEKREMCIKRTSAASSLVTDLEAKLPRVAASKLARLIASRLEVNLPKTAAQQIGDGLEPVLEESLRAWLLALREQKAASLQDAVSQVVSQQVEQLTLALELSPTLRELVLKETKEIVREQIQVMEKGMSLDVLTVPKGTPVNLYANLSASSLPYALLINLTYANDKAKLAKALLEISECPDLVEDKGHLFGCDAADDDKRALIEFLKTL
jgi:hypothetical protein